MPINLSDAQEQLLHRLFPWARSRQDPNGTALQALFDSEQWRRCVPDPTGAFHRTALMEGPLLAQEYDLTTHAHWDAWELGAAVVDLRGTILLNQRYGFRTGDQVLRAVAGALKTRFPAGKVVRIHDDAFAALLPPSAEEQVQAALAEELPPRLAQAVLDVLPEDGEPRPTPAFTVSLLRLKLRAPSHWQVIGPLAWAECERAHVLQRSGSVSGVQERLLDLAGPVPLSHR